MPEDAPWSLKVSATLLSISWLIEIVVARALDIGWMYILAWPTFIGAAALILYMRLKDKS